MRTLIGLFVIAVSLDVGCRIVYGQSDRPCGVKPPVKTQTWFNGRGSVSYDGVVEKIDADGMTVRWANERVGKEMSLEFLALDIHKAGKFQECATPPNSYLWSDVKTGDTVSVNTLGDQDGSKRYVTEICVRRRPGGKLPSSQFVKEDTRFQQDSMLNDIDNGEDVNEAEVNKVFPLKFDGQTGELSRKCGLPPEYRGKLAANREKLAAEKKNAELKATPPEKKDR